MANIYKGTLGLIGNTPLVEVTNIEKELGLEAKLLVKLEYFNPAGSVKDRVAKAMIEDAEEKGLLKEKPCRDEIMIDPKKKNPYRDEISKNQEIEPSENEKLMAEIKKCISELLELESQTEKLKKRLNAIKKQVEITDDETKGFYKL